jgi:hypothetical protein
VLWLYPEKVTGAQVTGTRAEESISAQQILLIGISLMGLYILIYGIVDLFKVESLLALQRQRALTSNFSLEFYEGQAIVDRITYLIQIVLGFFMVLGRNSLSRIILKVRYAGVTKTD